MKTHFWLGWFDSEARFDAFVEENSDAYEDNDIPLSEFAASQGEVWVDHDFMEVGFEPSAGDIEQKFKGYSFSNYWIDALEKRSANLDLPEINTIIMINANEIRSPKSVQDRGFRLVFVATIEYEVD